MDLLFEDKERNDISPANHNINLYSYYDLSGRKDIGSVRNLLNKWFLNYPIQERSELKARFKKTFSSTFFELFIHELFKSQGFDLTIHPILINSTKKPDYLIKKDDQEFYLEAKEAIR